MRIRDSSVERFDGLAATSVPASQETIFAAGAADDLPALVRTLGAESALVVSDSGDGDARAGAVVVNLRAAGLRAALYDGVEPNPSLWTVGRAAAALRDLDPRAAVLGVGGGAAVDAAKAIALQAANPAVPTAHLDTHSGLEPAAGPVLAVPTSAGPGAETTPFGVIDDPVAYRKRYVGAPSTLPRYAVLDPQLGENVSPRLTAAAGVEALARAIESAVSPSADAGSTELALEAIALLSERLPAAAAGGATVAERSELLRAAHLAGRAAAVSGLGTAHAVAHALSARHGTVPGVALAAVLPGVVAWNAAERPAESARIADAAGIAGGAAELPGAVAHLLRTLGLGVGLARIGATTLQLPALARRACADVVIRNAPRVPAEDELVALLRSAL